MNISDRFHRDDDGDSSPASSPRGGSSHSPRSPYSQPHSPQNPSPSTPAPSSSGHRVASSAQRQAQHQAAAEARRQQLDANFTDYAGPAWDPTIGNDEAVRQEALADDALSDMDRSLLADFRREVYKPVMTMCGRCKERWFDKNLVQGVCADCRKKDHNENEGVFFYSHANRMDYGHMPPHLPQLTPAEEMLIAKVHVAMECHRVRGAQYGYAGHVCHFLRDMAKVYNVLPLLPHDLPVIMVVPNNDRLRSVPRAEWRVRQGALRLWLSFLTRNNPEYKDGAVQISEANLSQLPEDGNIMDQLPVRILSDEQDDVDDDISDEDLKSAMAQEDASAVPDLLPDTTEVAQIRQTVVSAEALNAAAAAPAFQSTPVDELDNTRLWAGAFPTLLPFGNGDLAQLRPRTATVAPRPVCRPPPLRLCRLQQAHAKAHPRQQCLLRPPPTATPARPRGPRAPLHGRRAARPAHQRRSRQEGRRRRPGPEPGPQRPQARRLPALLTA